MKRCEKLDILLLLIPNTVAMRSTNRIHNSLVNNSFISSDKMKNINTK